MGKIKELTLEKQKLELKIQEIDLQIASLLDGVEPTSTPVPTVEPTATPQPTPLPTSTPVPTVEPTATPQPTSTPVNISIEIEVGNWSVVPSSLLVIKTTNDTTWLLQTDKNRTYYVIRGINHLDDKNVKITKPINKEKLSNEITVYGLEPAANGDLPVKWDKEWWASNGYIRNANGEFVKSNFIPTETPIPTSTHTTNVEKINIDNGVIFWDNWEYDYQGDPGLSIDQYLINHISKNRLAASEWKHKFELVPFYGKHTAPEKIKIRYNVVYDKTLGRNVYDEVEKEVTVKYDRTPTDRDREIQYYADAGFKFICYNYYSNDSYLSKNRIHFVNTNNKYGMKMTFMMAKERKDEEIDHITSLMIEDYWYKIDNKPVLFFNNNDYPDVIKYQTSYKNKTGGDIYMVYYAFGGYPTDVNDLMQKRPTAVSAYSQSSDNRTPEGLIQSEIASRNGFLGQYKHLFKIIPNLTLGLEELGLRTSLDPVRGPGVAACELKHIDEKCLKLIEDIKIYNKNEKIIPAVLWYSGNEILEGGVSIIPKLKQDGTIDTSVIDTISKYLK